MITPESDWTESVLHKWEQAKQQASIALLALMRFHSEELWRAGWMDGIEYALWDWANSRAEYRDLLVLAELCQQWWAWDDEAGGPVPVPLDEWIADRVQEVL